MVAFSALFGFAALALVVRGDIDCTTTDACQNGDYTCLGDGCQIDCSGQNACEDSEFTCQESCSVDCTNQDSCIAAQFHFYGGSVTLDCGQQDACENAIISGNNNTVLDVLCDGEDSCGSLQIVMYENSSFSIDCSGEDSCDSATCYCFSDANCETSGDLECSDTVEHFQRHYRHKNKKHHGPAPAHKHMEKPVRERKENMPHFKKDKKQKMAPKMMKKNKKAQVF